MHLALLLLGTSLCQAADIKPDDNPNSSETSAIDFEAIYKADVMNTVSGGLKRGTSSLSNLDLKLTLDGEKCWAGVTPLFSYTA